jgi:hypothetical protein
MGRLADGIAAIYKGRGISRGITLGLVMAGVAAVAGNGQAPPSSPPPPKPAAPAAVSGCVQKAPGSSTTLVISSATVCATLAGKVSVDQLSGHQVDLTGVLTPRTASTGASIQVDSVANVGKSCSDVCSLLPPHSRGLHAPGAVPGSEGATPGLTAPPPGSDGH